AQRAAPRPVRVRVPVRPAGPRADRRGEHRAAAAAVGHPARPGDGGGPAVVPRARPRRPGAPPVRWAGRRAGAARSPRPLPGRRAGGGVVAGRVVQSAGGRTGAVASVSGELVMDLLTAAVGERGTTVVLVTHDARVAAYADREVVVRDGKVGPLPGAPP